MIAPGLFKTFERRAPEGDAIGALAPVVDVSPDAFLTQAQVAALLQVRPRQVQRLGVTAVRLGHRTLRYRRSDVERWLAERVERG